MGILRTAEPLALEGLGRLARARDAAAMAMSQAASDLQRERIRSALGSLVDPV
jgi:hypothetical protein